jgi:hypothetical protein
LDFAVKCPPLQAAVVAAAIFVNHDARAEDFNERWGALARNSQASVDAAAPVAQQEKKAESQRFAAAETKRYSRARRHRFHSGNTRHREWYKGGKKWRYVYSRRR